MRCSCQSVVVRAVCNNGPRQEGLEYSGGSSFIVGFIRCWLFPIGRPTAKPPWRKMWWALLELVRKLEVYSPFFFFSFWETIGFLFFLKWNWRVLFLECFELKVIKTLMIGTGKAQVLKLATHLLVLLFFPPFLFRVWVELQPGLICHFGETGGTRWGPEFRASTTGSPNSCIKPRPSSQRIAMETRG